MRNPPRVDPLREASGMDEARRCVFSQAGRKGVNPAEGVRVGCKSGDEALRRYSCGRLPEWMKLGDVPLPQAGRKWDETCGRCPGWI